MNHVTPQNMLTKLIKTMLLTVAISFPIIAISACASASQSNDKIRASGNSYGDAKTSQPTAVDSVDLTRYAGTWHEVARLPMYFQRNCVSDVTATYTLNKENNENTKVAVLNSCRKEDGSLTSAEGVAVPANETGSKLKVTFMPKWLRWLPVGRANYWILALDEGYQNAMVGTPDKEYLWLLSRTPVMNNTTYDKYLQLAQQQGYDINSLKVDSMQLDKSLN